MRRVNLGAGSDIRAGFVNVDWAALPGVDIVHNLDVLPWPFEDASVDEIIANDIFEHVNDALGFVNEIGRILKPGGVLRMRTCHWQHINAHTDPTHRRFPTEHTMDYWIKGTEFFEKYAGAYAAPGVAFERIKIERDGSELLFVLRRI